MAALIQLRACHFIWLRSFAEDSEYRRMRSDLLADLDGIEINPKDFDDEALIGSTQLIVRPPSRSELAFVDWRKWGKDRYICIEFKSADYDLDVIKSKIESSDQDKISNTEREDFALHFLMESIRDFSGKFLLLVNVCYLGCLNSGSSIRYLGRKVFSRGGGCHSWIANAYLENEYIKKPLHPRVTIQDALQWSKACRGYWQGVAEERLEKAMACLTHVFSVSDHATDTFSDLLWSLSGLESLYCDSESGIAYQIKRRAPLIVDRFGFVSLSKTITKGYGFRSRLFHGDVPIRSKLIEEPTDHKRDYALDAGNHSSFFLLLLTCSILSCIEDGRNSIGFRENLT